MALLIDPLASGHFAQLARVSLEAAVALGLSPDIVQDELPDALAPLLHRLAGGTGADATAALSLLRQTLRDIGGRNIPALAAPEEAKRIQLLVALSRRLGKPHLVPGMTVHQAKGREWNDVAVLLTAGQQARLAAGLVQAQAGDRAIYVALTRARRSVRAVPEPAA
jgi:DNA helicase-2/ATP-dependent DNA helicase PcrA